jgi:hypothetical protein
VGVVRTSDPVVDAGEDPALETVAIDPSVRDDANAAMT